MGQCCCRLVESRTAQRTNECQISVEGTGGLRRVRQLDACDATRRHLHEYGCRKSPGGGRCGQVHVTAERLEDYVIPLLRTLANSPNVWELLESENEANVNELRDLVAERAEHLVKQRRIQDDYGDGKINAETHGRQYKRIQERLDPIEA